MKTYTKDILKLDHRPIVEMYENQKSISEIARKYHITRRTVCKILKIENVYCINKFSDLTGRHFGHLEVTGMVMTKGKRNRIKAICHCHNCNRDDYLVLPFNLKQGHVASCGCAREHYKNITGAKNKVFTGYKDIRGSFWFRLKQGAKRRGLAFDITIEDAWDLYEKQNRLCALTGLPIFFGRVGKKDENTASLDRKDSLKGYSIDNIQWVYKTVNGMKMCFPQEYFINFCRLVANNPNLAWVKNLTVADILKSDESYSGKRKMN